MARLAPDERGASIVLQRMPMPLRFLPPRGLAVRGGALAMVAAVYAASYLLWLGLSDWSTPVRAVVDSLAFLPLHAVTALAFLLASRTRALDPRVRRALRLLAAGTAFVAGGRLVWAIQEHLLGADPTLSWANVFFVATYGAFLAAVLSFPVARSDRAERWRFLLDVAIVLLGAGIVVGYLQLVPEEGRGIAAVEQVVALAYPLVGMLLLTAIVATAMRRPTDPNRRAYVLVIAGMLAGVLGDVLSEFVLEPSLRWSELLTDGVCALSYVLLVFGAERYRTAPVAPTDDLAEPPPPAAFSPVAVVAVIGGYGLLVYVALRSWPSALSQIAVASAVLTMLVLLRLVATARENARLQGETAARETERRFRSLVQHSSDVITVVDVDSTVRFVSPAIARVFGYQPEALVGTRLTAIIHPDDRSRAAASLADAANRPSVPMSPAGWRVRHRDGTWLFAETLATNLLPDPSVRGIVLNTRDVSERQALERQLTHQAFHDPLTGLANRALFRDRVQHALAVADRQQRRLAVLFLDLDDFKKVNDSLGHGEGDQLLVAAAGRLQACARTADTVARLGGDEFAILVEDVTDGTACHVVATRVVDAMGRPFSLSGTEVFVSASVGIASAGGGENADELLRNADLAMYLAKSRGKGCYEMYEARMHARVLARLELEADLRRAIEHEEMRLRFQPIVELATGALAGVEALVRWQHPSRGLLGPIEFVSLAEETGIVVPLGTWVLREACRQARRWADEHPGRALTVTINISSRQLQHADFIETVQRALGDTGVDPATIVLELTESMLMQHTPSTLERLRALKALGVRLAIDDFGTGYSSLSYLQRFPLDILKIAKPFVDSLSREPGEGREQPGPSASDSALARAVITLCDTLGLRTIAEGVEREAQRVELLAMGCDLGQGYRFAPPLEPGEISRLLRQPTPAFAIPVVRSALQAV